MHTRRSEYPPSEGLCWPLASWEAYVNSRPGLHITDEGPLQLIVRGDGYPVAGGTWSQLTVGLANHGPSARQPAFCWVIALALWSNKEMVALGELWDIHFKVCHFWCICQWFCILALQFVPFKVQKTRTGRPFLNFEHLLNTWNAPCLNVRQVLQEVLDTGLFMWKGAPRAAQLWLGGDSPWIRRIIGVSTAPQVGSIYNEGVWSNDTKEWQGHNVPRTLETDAAHHLAFLAEGRSLSHAGCSTTPLAPEVPTPPRGALHTALHHGHWPSASHVCSGAGTATGQGY